MSNYNSLKATINANIKTNGNQEITGSVLNSVLNAMVDSIGGYQYAGVATPSMNPGSPDQNVFYLAGQGAYPNFGDASIEEGFLGILKYNGSWSVEVVPVGKDFTADIESLDAAISEINKKLYGGADTYSGSIPMVAGSVNQRSSGAKCVMDIPAGDYTFNINTSFVGNGCNIYVMINGTTTFLGNVGTINGHVINIPGDATELNIYANAANSLRTGDCTFSMVEAYPETGLIPKVESLEQSVSQYDSLLNGNSKSKDVSFELVSTAQTAANTKKDISIDSGKYWVDVSPMSLLKSNNVYVYAYYKSNPGASVLIGYLSTNMSDYWTLGNATYLQEIEFSDDVVALSIYHAANAVNEGTITLSFVDQNAELSLSSQIERINAKNNPAFTGYHDKSTIAAGGVLSLPKIHVTKDSSLSVEINGNAENVQFGVGYDGSKNNKRGYTAYWCKLTSSTIEIYYSDNTDVLLQTIQHGLTLDDRTKVTIRISNGVGKRDIIIVTKAGQEYRNTTNINFFGVGSPFIENGGNASIIGEISFIPCALPEKIWVFGDSYCGVNNPGRWMTQILGMGIINFLLNARGGEAAKEAVGDLENILSCGYVPTYIVWALGMNGASDPSTTSVSDFQKLWLMRFMRICSENGITPILCTIPSVPGIMHEAYNAYIKTLGVRIIDLADAVGAQSDGTWYPGLLSSDNVHPSKEGARVLAMRVLRDFQEIQMLES